MTAVTLNQSVASELPVWRVRRELAFAGLVTGVVAAVLLVVGPAPGDAAAHLYRTLLVQHGVLVWDNYWYAGDYPLSSYSLLYYLPAAVVGNLPLVFAAAVGSTVLFASVALREWGSAAFWPCRVFGVLAAAPLFTGLYSYSLGFAAMLGTLKALQVRRTVVAFLLAALTVGFSPLAFAFLVLILGAVFLANRRTSKRTLLIGAGLVAVAGVQVTALVVFPSGNGVYPFHPVDFGAILGLCVLGVLVGRRARLAAPLVAFYTLWGLGSVIVFLVPSPLGDNWTRLAAFAFPLMLLTASLSGFRPRRLVALALAVSFAYNVTPYLLLIPYRLDNRPASASFWQPAIAFLRHHLQPGFRVEVVPTAAHWESYWIPKAGFPLARGWYRQTDEVDNSVLYSSHLDAASYRRWLRSAAVEYVLLASTQLDWDGGPREAKVIQSRSSGLTLAFRSSNWRIYRLSNPTPLVTGPGRARVIAVGHTTIRMDFSASGRYLLRTHYSPYWSVRGPGCVRPGPARLTWLQVDRPGSLALSVASSAEGFLDGLTSRHRGAC